MRNFSSDYAFLELAYGAKHLTNQPAGGVVAVIGEIHTVRGQNPHTNL
jgi:hypothetical protein